MWRFVRNPQNIYKQNDKNSLFDHYKACNNIIPDRTVPDHHSEQVLHRINDHTGGVSIHWILLEILPLQFCEKESDSD